jgi:hypothetical protein
MPEMKLDAADAAELAEMLQFLSDWLARDPARLGASLGRSWAEEGLAVVAAEQEDEALQVVAQLGQAVGGVADELGPVPRASRPYAGPCGPQRRSSSRCALRALHADPRRGPGLTGTYPGKGQQPDPRNRQASPGAKPSTIRWT